MSLHKIEIKCPEGNPDDTKILLDGEPLNGVVSVEFSIRANEAARVKLEMVAGITGDFTLHEKIYEGKADG